MNPEKIFILANRQARGKNEEKLNQALEQIKDQIATEIIYTQSALEAKEKAQQLSKTGKNIVAACGGDGTINSVLQGIDDNGILGIIPSGTANVIARELGIPLNFTLAVRNLLTAAVKKIDVGLCNGQRFLFVAGTGFDAQVAAKVPSQLKRMLGKFAYHLTSAKELLTYTAPQLTISFNDGRKPLEGEFAIIANMRRYGGDLFFAPEARYDDGILDVILLKKFRIPALLRLFNYARRTGPFPQEDVHAIKAESFTINAAQECPFQLDGEAYEGQKSFYFSVKKQKINVLIP